MNTQEDRIIKLIAKNVPLTVIAGIVGCDVSYVSQISSGNSEKISALKYDSLVAQSARDERLNGLEDKAIDIVERKLDTIKENPFLMKSPSEAVRILSMINGLKRRGAASEGDTVLHQSNTVINISLPHHIVNKYAVATTGNVLDGEAVVIDAYNNVRVAGEQELVTMPSGTLKGMGNKEKDNVQNISVGRKKVPLSFD
jgi:hypothetical protein